MVLPVRIELTTSALPRMRSTTELRQHFVRKGAPMTVAPFACQPVARLADDRHAVGVTGKDKEREERLAAALRENLKRRKAQAREATEVREDKKGV
jgi:microcystin degradation protein MlrC